MYSWSLPLERLRRQSGVATLETDGFDSPLLDAICHGKLTARSLLRRHVESCVCEVRC